MTHYLNPVKETTAVVPYTPPPLYRVQYNAFLQKVQEAYITHSFKIQIAEARLLRPAQMDYLPGAALKVNRSIILVPAAAKPSYCKPIWMDKESWNGIVSEINNLFEGVFSYKDFNGQVCTSRDSRLRLQYPQSFSYRDYTIGLWPEGDAVLLTGRVVGSGLNKTVKISIDLREGKECASAFVDHSEIEMMDRLKGKRGIAQIYNHMFFSKQSKHFFYGALYNTDLEKALNTRRCRQEDLAVIVKDLVYAMIALEGDDPKGDWISHRDLKDANVYLKVEKTSGRVTGAYLGDFGSASLLKTVEIDAETLKRDRKKLGPGWHRDRETQRKEFISYFFHNIKSYVEDFFEEPIVLADLCAGDPICQKLMAEMEKNYDYLLNRDYFHWAD